MENSSKVKIIDLLEILYIFKRYCTCVTTKNIIWDIHHKNETLEGTGGDLDQLARDGRVRPSDAGAPPSSAKSKYHEILSGDARNPQTHHRRRDGSIICRAITECQQVDTAGFLVKTNASVASCSQTSEGWRVHANKGGDQKNLTFGINPTKDWDGLSDATNVWISCFADSIDDWSCKTCRVIAETCRAATSRTPQKAQSFTLRLWGSHFITARIVQESLHLQQTLCFSRRYPPFSLK